MDEITFWYLLCTGQTAREVSSLFKYSDTLNLDQSCVCWSQNSSCTTALLQGLELIIGAGLRDHILRSSPKTMHLHRIVKRFFWGFCVLTSNYGNKHSPTKSSNHNMLQSHVKKAKKSLLNLLIQKHLLIKFKLHNFSACLRPGELLHTEIFQLTHSWLKQLEDQFFLLQDQNLKGVTYKKKVTTTENTKGNKAGTIPGQLREPYKPSSASIPVRNSYKTTVQVLVHRENVFTIPLYLQAISNIISQSYYTENFNLFRSV